MVDNKESANELFSLIYTDEEIARSFIEDVEAVKDSLPQESEVQNEH